MFRFSIKACEATKIYRYDWLNLVHATEMNHLERCMVSCELEISFRTMHISFARKVKSNQKFLNS